MPGKLQAEIQQRRRFRNLESEALLNILRTADGLTRAFEEAFKPSGLSSTQYNVLRILRGAGSEGLACRQVGERMITHDPDITRLLDRLEKRGLVARARDRRVVATRISPAGLRVLARLEPGVA
ncbi:MAG: MarR family winged helix-turn-helix transcriptional regulator, partial [Candidatus Acidiferrales bacterium]